MRSMMAITTLVVIALAPVARADRLEDVLAKNLTAHGGEAKLRDLRTLRLTGRVVFGGGDFSLEAAWAQVEKRSTAGDMVRTETTIQGLTQISAYDGREGWTVSPFQGRIDAEKASDDDARSIAQQSEVDGPLIGWRAKGHRVEYL